MAMEVEQIQGEGGEVLYQVHLIGFGHSGRAVRFRELSESKVDSLEADAAAIVGTEEGPLPFGYRLSAEIKKQGACRFVVAITEDPVPAEGSIKLKPKDPQAATKQAAEYPACGQTKWVKMNFQAMESLGGGRLTHKDIEALRVMYVRLHNVSVDDIEGMMGKALRVTGG
jgi:hypothetical protein